MRVDPAAFAALALSFDEVAPRLFEICLGFDCGVALVGGVQIVEDAIERTVVSAVHDRINDIAQRNDVGGRSHARGYGRRRTPDRV